MSNVRDIREKITRELANLRIRQPDESPEAKVIDTERTHSRINALLDALDRAAVSTQSS